MLSNIYVRVCFCVLNRGLRRVHTFQRVQFMRQTAGVKFLFFSLSKQGIHIAFPSVSPSLGIAFAEFTAIAFK